MNILLVCTGNTCRSAMAEELFDDAVDRSSSLKGKVKVKSAGTFVCEGAEATPQAIRVMDEVYDLDLDRHKAVQYTAELGEWADIILTMEAAQIDQLEAMDPESADKMHTLIGYAKGIKGYPGDDQAFDIEDPYGEGFEEYKSCAHQLNELVQVVVKQLEDEIGD